MSNYYKMMLALLAVFLLSVVPMALAQESGAGAAAGESAGVTPDSILYGVDKAIDRLRIALTFDKAKRAEKSLAVASERLAEVKKMLEEGKSSAVVKAELEYEASIKKSEESVDEIESEADSEKARKSLEKLAKIKDKIESHRQHVVEVHEAILERMKDRLTAEQYDRLSSVFARIQNRSLKFEERLDVKRESAKVKYKVLSGKSEDEVKLEIESIDRQAGLEDARKSRTKSNIARANAAIARAEEKLETLDLTEEERLELQAHIDFLRQVISEAEASESENSLSARELSELSRDFGNEVSAVARLLGDAKKNLTNESFDEVKARLKATISARQEEHKRFVLEKLRERAELSNKTDIRIRIEQRIEGISESRTRIDARMVDEEGRVDVRIRERENDGKIETRIVSRTNDVKERGQFKIQSETKDVADKSGSADDSNSGSGNSDDIKPESDAEEDLELEAETRVR